MSINIDGKTGLMWFFWFLVFIGILIAITPSDSKPNTADTPKRKKLKKTSSSIPDISEFKVRDDIKWYSPVLRLILLSTIAYFLTTLFSFFYSEYINNYVNIPIFVVIFSGISHIIASIEKRRVLN